MQAHLINTNFVDSYKIFQNKKYFGKSDHNHQIDISIELKILQIDLLILIECKKYSKSIEISEVLEFATRIDDISAHKGIMVSTKGFQEGAIKIAKSKRIALVIASDLGLVPYIGDPDYFPLQSLSTEIKNYYTWYRDLHKNFKINFDLIPLVALLDKHYSVLGEFCYLKNRVFKSENDRLKLYPVSSDEDYLKVANFCGHGYTFIGENSTLTVSNDGLYYYIILEYLLARENEIK